LSPQTRRGRSVPPRHSSKSPSHGSVDAGQKPVGAPEATVANEGKSEAKSVQAHPPTGLRHRGPARPRRFTWLRNVYRYTGAYLPLFGAFVALFAAFWVYRSFVNPPPPEPQQLWTTIESKYSAKIDAARLEINDPKSDFATRIQGFKDYRDDLKAWMSALSPITDWTVGAVSTASADYVTAGQDIGYLVTYGNQEANLLDQASTAKSEADLANYTTQLAAANSLFEGQLASVRFDMGLTAVDQPTLALPPTPNPSESPGASGSPGASSVPGTSPTVAPSASPVSPSASPTAASS
jgi:hypothetical protein